ncbi:MAG: transketolase, partial [Oligoflexia bacterium]|nr:transketolase [Oligoflexia bacterium]
MSSIHGIMFNYKVNNKADRSINREWYEKFNFVNDAGHTENGIYALRANLGYNEMTFESLKEFRSIRSPLTGHAEARLNPQGVLMSNGPLGSGLPQAQGLSIADKIIGNDRITFCVISDAGLMEGEAKESLAVIPGLAKKNRLNPFVMVISFNNKKLSGIIDNDAYSIVPTLDSLKTLGWKLLYIEDGHNLQETYLQIEKAVELSKKKGGLLPVAIIAKTIKGYGTKKTAADITGAHAFPLKRGDKNLVEFVEEILVNSGGLSSYPELKKMVEDVLAEGASVVTPPLTTYFTSSFVKLQKGISSAIIKAAEESLPVYSVCADLQNSTGMKEFHQKFPNNFIEVGVAEANMISTAAGLSRSGFIPIVDTFTQFGVSKGKLPIIMSQLSLAPIIAVFSHAGLQDAGDGASHQATTYIAALSGIPNVDLVCCSCVKEVEAFMYQAIKRFALVQQNNKPQNINKDNGKHIDNTNNTVIFFIGREDFPLYHQENVDYVLGYPYEINNLMNTNVNPNNNSKENADLSADLLIVATGPMVGEALCAQKILLSKNIKARLINNPFVNHPNVEIIAKAL